MDTTQITVDWTTPEEFKQHKHERPAMRLNPIPVVTKEGFTVPIKAELILNIFRKNAPRVVALAGGQEGLIHDVVVPFLYDIASRVVSDLGIKDLIEKREDIRQSIETAVGTGLENYPIDLIAFRITQFDFESDLDPETKKFVDLITQQRSIEENMLVLGKQINYQEKRREFKEAEAFADNQDIVVKAKLQQLVAPIQCEVIKARKEVLEGLDIMTAVVADPDALSGAVSALVKFASGFMKKQD